jgi:hypothetical protein
VQRGSVAEECARAGGVSLRAICLTTFEATAEPSRILIYLNIPVGRSLSWFHLLHQMVGSGGPKPLPFCIQDRWSGGDAWMGCRGRGIVDDLQIFAGRHNMVGYNGF